MPQNTSPFKTPTGFFESQQSTIWEHANAVGIPDERHYAGFPTWIGWTAGLAAALVLALLVGPASDVSDCQTFACLWEATPSEHLHLDDTEIDLWMEDDLLFETMINDATDV